MNDIYTLILIISLFAGVSSLSISCFIYNTTKKNTLKFFIAMNLSFFAIQSSISLGFYLKYAEQVSFFMPILYNLLDFTGTCSISLLGLYFIHHLFGLEITNIKRKLFSSIFLLQFIGIVLYYIFKDLYYIKTLLHISIITVILYEIYIGIKNYKQIIDENLKLFIKFFMILTIVFLPFIIAEYSKSYIELIRNNEFLKISALPSYFLAISIFNIVFTMKYFNTPSYISDNKLTSYFKEKYGITEKQSEIIELLLEGKTYKQIAETLFISPKTVDNHIQNIYKKLNVKSKIQLSNFIRSNE